MRPISRPMRRRHALKILAATAALPLGVLALRETQAQPAAVTWQGVSLGGPVGMTLWHADQGFARSTILRMRSEIERLEAIFSLYRNDSEIVQLNRAGRLDRASPDLRNVLAMAQEAAEASGGAFDPTVQPLWRLYEAHFRAQPQSLDGPEPTGIAAARALVDYQGVEIGGNSVRFARPGMAVTLNGIAQGYITDRISDLLRNEGFAHALVDMGETRALGTEPDGHPWLIGIKNPVTPTIVDRQLSLSDMALSVSGGYGTRFGGSGLHHIFDPATGRSAQGLLDVVVLAPRATLADTLSTAIYVAGEAKGAEILRRFPGARASVTRSDGVVVNLAS